VYDTLRDTLSVKVGEEVDQVKVLQEKRAIFANSLRGFGVENLKMDLGLGISVLRLDVRTGQPLEVV
jgi:hypothetical protein